MLSEKISVREQMNAWAGKGIPFLFIIDFELEKPLIFRLESINKRKILYHVNGLTNCEDKGRSPVQLKLVKHHETFEEYLAKFNNVKEHISYGNSYLVNLTCSSRIELNLSLKEVFLMSNAKYRIWFDEQFICFSPETFVRIQKGIISSFPMKGTIDAMIQDAEKVILNDSKETAEHSTIVDLIRNDLNKVSKGVKVERFRYIDTIITNEKKLLQVSSEISGELDPDYKEHIGDIIYSLLPAGSVSGAPKKKTAEIIAETENGKRGYYTGIFGIFDGANLDSGVIIRFIEKKDAGYFYRSGGGITIFSDPLSEYNEMIDKIYVPIV